MSIYEHHVIGFAHGRLGEVSQAIADRGREAVEAKGGRLFGVWKPLIGLHFNSVVCVTEWPDERHAMTHANAAIAGVADTTTE